jgi:hypothetical protein
MSNKAERAAIARLQRNAGNLDFGPGPSTIIDMPPTSPDEFGGRPTSSARPARRSAAGTSRAHEDEFDGHNDPHEAQYEHSQARLQAAQRNTLQALKTAVHTSEHTNAIADETLGALAVQGDTLRRTTETSGEVVSILSLSKKALREMKMAAMKEHIVKSGILLLLFLAIVLIVYIKFLKRNN